MKEYAHHRTVKELARGSNRMLTRAWLLHDFVVSRIEKTMPGEGRMRYVPMGTKPGRAARGGPGANVFF
jgi:hypothetical protein